MTDTIVDFDEALTKYDPVLGFDVHVELNTKTKMFSSAPNSFGEDPNTNITEVCLGLPGALPMVNKQAVEYAIKLGLALNCQIADYCRFARKHYFYPDLSKNYQTSQSDEPIAFDGYVDVIRHSGRTSRRCPIAIFVRACIDCSNGSDASELIEKRGVGQLRRKVCRTER